MNSYLSQQHFVASERRGLAVRRGALLKKAVMALAVFALVVVAARAQQPDEPTGDMIPAERLRDEVEADAKELVAFRVLATWNTIPAITSLIGQFRESRRLNVIKFSPVDSDQVLERLSRQECDVGMPFDSFVPEKSRNFAKQVPRATVGGFVLAVAVAVNAKTSVRSVTLPELRRVFSWNLLTGGATSWSDVRGSGSTAKVEMFRPARFSPASLVFRKVVGIEAPFTDELFDPAERPPSEKPTDAQVIETIVKRPNAIGFFLYRCGEKPDARIRILRVAKDKESEAVLPSESTLADRSYPLVDWLTLYLRPGAPAEATEFSKFAAGPEGAKIVKQCGLWPEYELNEVRGVKRLADVKAHRGVEVAVGGSAALQSLMKELGAEFSKAKTAVEIKYHAGTQNAAIGEFVGGEASQPSPPAPLPEGEGRNTELVLIDAMIETKTAHDYDKAWKAIRPAKVTLGWRAAALEVWRKFLKEPAAPWRGQARVAVEFKPVITRRTEGTQDRSTGCRLCCGTMPTLTIGVSRSPPTMTWMRLLLFGCIASYDLHLRLETACYLSLNHFKRRLFLWIGKPDSLGRRYFVRVSREG
jgi:ABC-type phosphate transport system substrate-binding protein